MNPTYTYGKRQVSRASTFYLGCVSRSTVVAVTSETKSKGW